MPIASGKAYCSLSVRAERGDQRLVDASGQDHERGVASLGVGDAKAGDELALFAHQREGAGQLHAAAVDDCDLVAIGHELGDGLACGMKQLFVLESGTAKFDNESHSKPSSSFHPHIRFMF